MALKIAEKYLDRLALDEVIIQSDEKELETIVGQLLLTAPAKDIIFQSNRVYALELQVNNRKRMQRQIVHGLYHDRNTAYLSLLSAIFEECVNLQLPPVYKHLLQALESTIKSEAFDCDQFERLTELIKTSLTKVFDPLLVRFYFLTLSYRIVYVQYQFKHNQERHFSGELKETATFLQQTIRARNDDSVRHKHSNEVHDLGEHLVMMSEQLEQDIDNCDFFTIAPQEALELCGRIAEESKGYQSFLNKMIDVEKRYRAIYDDVSKIYKTLEIRRDIEAELHRLEQRAETFAPYFQSHIKRDLAHLRSELLDSRTPEGHRIIRNEIAELTAELERGLQTDTTVPNERTQTDLMKRAQNESDNGNLRQSIDTSIACYQLAPNTGIGKDALTHVVELARDQSLADLFFPYLKDYMLKVNFSTYIDVLANPKGWFSQHEDLEGHIADVVTAFVGRRRYHQDIGQLLLMLLNNRDFADEPSLYESFLSDQLRRLAVSHGFWNDALYQYLNGRANSLRQRNPVCALHYYSLAERIADAASKKNIINEIKNITKRIKRIRSAKVEPQFVPSDDVDTDHLFPKKERTNFNSSKVKGLARVIKSQFPFVKSMHTGPFVADGLAHTTLSDHFQSDTPTAPIKIILGEKYCKGKHRAEFLLFLAEGNSPQQREEAFLRIQAKFAQLKL